MIYMIVRDKNAHDGLHGNTHVFQELSDCSRWNPCIDQYAMKLITYVITIPAASAAETAKIQFHCFFVLIWVKGICLCMI